MSEFQSVNEGTNNKGKLQEMAMKCIKNYPSNQPLKIYAEYLSWDIKVTVRTALESYIIPMMRKGYFIHINSDTYTQASNNQPQNNVTDNNNVFLKNKCKKCGKPTPNTTFCSKDCVEQYKNEKENPTDCKSESFMEYAKTHPHEKETSPSES